MPNWSGQNQKSLDAKQAKDAARKQKLVAEQARKEDLAWKDSVTEAKISKREELLSKQQEKAQRKVENRRLAEEETNAIKSNKKGPAVPAKMSRAEIQQKALLAALNSAKALKAKNQPEPLQLENLNRLRAQEREVARAEGVQLVSASSVSEFLQVANGSSAPADRFPEKRLKAAYTAYEERWMPLLKAEFPSLKRSQLKEKIWKQWQKSPDNPLNQVETSN